MQPFAPWDPRGVKARGRDNWESDVVIALDRTAVARDIGMSVSPNGVLITRETIPVSYFLWVAAWTDDGWVIIMDQRAGDLPITGTTGSRTNQGVHPDVLANQRCAELDREAAIIEDAGRNSGVPPPPRKEGKPERLETC